ncbi:MAG: putative rane protein [Herbinix sp.]|jgi:D-alanyl-D-alanine carboxypeptidase (penicillin-binding protein 5/6)|nr:putative rane protein [Herbinix sp.]
MSKKNILGLILFGGITTLSLFIGVHFMINNDTDTNSKSESNRVEYTNDDILEETQEKSTESVKKDLALDDTENILTSEPWLAANPTEGNGTQDTVQSEEDQPINGDVDQTASAPLDSPVDGEDFVDNDSATDVMSGNKTGGIKKTEEEDNSIDTFGEVSPGEEALQLIYDCTAVDYESYIPEMILSSKIETALDINNPSIKVDATAAILFDADTKEVLYYKNPIDAVFPASTAKLLTSLVALDWCTLEEEVKVGDEVTMIASDSTKAYLKEGQILTVKSLLEGMLLPSGNDAAYVMATYVGRKSLKDSSINNKDAVKEFIRLMNKKAKELGAVNSCFMTPDGYDAIGQYTTAYDMGLIGLTASKNETITEISQLDTGRNIFISGEDVTWTNTNALIKEGSGKFYSYAIGLKTGTSTMAGRCIIAAAQKDGKEVVCAIMDSTSSGRWDDAIELLDYGLNH